MIFLITDYQGLIIGLIPKMPKFTQLIFEHCYINCLLIKIWENRQTQKFSGLRAKAHFSLGILPPALKGRAMEFTDGFSEGSKIVIKPKITLSITPSFRAE